MTKPLSERELALDILTEVLENKSPCHIVLRQALSKYQYLEKRQRAFLSRLTEGVVEYLLQLDAILNLFSKVPVKKMKPAIRNILRMSVYQILYMDRIPDSAVCNEAVNLAVKKHFAGLKGFVNGILRTVVREKDHIWKFIESDISVHYSMPSWMISRWTEQYGDERTLGIMRAFLQESPTFVRCNLSKTDQETVVKSLERQKVSVENAPYQDSVLKISGYDYLERLDAFQKGWIQVQDLSSCLAVEAARPVKGDFVIDVCAAPGGKSLHAADLLTGTGHVEARDLTDEKVHYIEENIRRSGFSNITAKKWDARIHDPESVGRADIVLADLPCSGLGVAGRKPDIKYRVTRESMEQLIHLQREILSVVWNYVKPGGILVYTTCTINSAENEGNADWFLKQFPFSPVSLRERLGSLPYEESMDKGWVQLLPGIHPCDGFFISVMRREGGSR